MLQTTVKRLLSVALIAHLCTISLADTQDIKTWHPNTNFLNPRNWESEQLPCENDRIIFPETLPVISMMPESLTVGELVLPVNGEIIFPEKAAIELTGGKREGACIGKDARFKVNKDYWYDPTNWNITSDFAFPSIANRRNAAVPHAFQIPCPTDKVRFPENTTFQSHVFYPLTKVASMSINGLSYSQRDFDELLRTHVGSMLFPQKTNFLITSVPCTDETGCTCGNDAPQMQSIICQETPSCPSVLDCSDPITPVGNCCPVCGARIMIKNKSKFEISRLMTLFASFLNKELYGGVESFTAKTHKGDIQSVFVDGAQQMKGLANKVAQQIYDILNSDINGAHLYEIHSVSVYKSEVWKANVITYDHISSGMSSGGIAALVIVFIVIFGLAALFYIYRRRHITGFDFARFDLRGDKIELELGTTPHDELQPPADPPAAESSKEEASKGFDNPVYGTAVEEVSSPVYEYPETKDFVENPMFMIFEETSKPDSKEDE